MCARARGAGALNLVRRILRSSRRGPHRFRLSSGGCKLLSDNPIMGVLVDRVDVAAHNAAHLSVFVRTRRGRYPADKVKKESCCRAPG